MIVAGLFAAMPLFAAQAMAPKQQVLAGFGECLERRSPDAARELLVTDFGSATERKKADSIARSGVSCLQQRRGLSMKTGEIRGAIAEAAFARRPDLLEKARALPDAEPERPPVADGRAFLIAYAGCLVQATPARSAALIATPLGSAQERGAFVALGAPLQGCMPDGLRYNANVTDIRNHVAAALYRQAVRSGE